MYWLLKSDPETYSFLDLLRDKKTSWDGIRNYAARNHLKKMNKGDIALVYHSGGESIIIGTAKILGSFYPDPTAPENEDWASVEIQALKKFKTPVTLKEIKAHFILKNMMLAKISRLSVTPVTEEEFNIILLLGEK